MGEQLTFFPFWSRTFGEFEIFGPEDFTVEGWTVSAEYMRFLERGALVDDRHLPDPRVGVHTPIERNYDDPT